jgi:predicted lipoprotein with Yx(FWY)xxD motif
MPLTPLGERDTVTDAAKQEIVLPRRRRRTIMDTGLIATALALSAVFAAMALASIPATIGSASNAKLGHKLLVNAKGRTLYALTPETTRHLLCTSSECIRFWPPLTVPSRRTKLVRAAGVRGKLALLQRRNGTLQVTLNGLPLYRFAGDHAGGEVNGQNFKGFGGVWHVLSISGSPSAAAPAGSSAPASSSPTTSTPSTSTPTTTTPSTPGYQY